MDTSASHDEYLVLNGSEDDAEGDKIKEKATDVQEQQNVSSDEDSSDYEDGDEDSELEMQLDDDDMTESNDSLKEQIKQAALLRKYMRKSEDELDLPETVSVLTGPSGERVYVVGTAHFSKESCTDVQKVISMVQPDAVIVELCASRVSVLSMDEEQLANMSDGSRMERLKKCVKQKGILSGLVLYMMLHMSAHITKELKMAPGSEFRAALKEMKTVPGCRLYLGDRPIEITLQRMLAALSFWQKLKFGFLILQELKPISAEDVEKMKQRDIFEQLLEEMMEEFPHVATALVAERDIYLAGYMQKTMKMPVVLPDDSIHPAVVVGVVGIGHTTGIKAHFDTEITEEQLNEISRMPPPSRTGKMVKFFLKGVVFATAAYVLYGVACWTGIPRRLSYWTSDV
uniref:TraB domain-containing protein n=1 Tax=Phallusia mammillata TaxID=59560 RepID=A0A6F9DW53_9ASCI|nr:traB domain-containing protein [Phallusia mammillata]